MSAVAVGLLLFVGASSLFLYGLLAHRLTPRTSLARPRVVGASPASSSRAATKAASRPGGNGSAQQADQGPSGLGPVAAALSVAGLLAPSPSETSTDITRPAQASPAASPSPEPAPSSSPQPEPTPAATPTPTPTPTVEPSPTPTDSVSPAPTTNV